jgi:tetratricopeptide (TPR) repeat protein
MTMRDPLGLEISGADQDSLHHYQEALEQFQCYVGDPLASLDAAHGRRPEMVMAHVLRAWLNLLGTEPKGLAAAREAYRQAAALPHNAREQGHLEAIGALLEGRWKQASVRLEDVSIIWPQDILALQAGHLLDFFCGHGRMLRDRISRALPEWRAHMPGYHALLGMHAFGLEENADYLAAERAGRRAVDLQPRDGWAQHAVAHVLEMQNRPGEGIAWMRERLPHWAGDSFFQVHNWWHLALFHLDLEQFDEVLALFDGPIFGARSALVLDLVDATAMLWRLQLLGVEVGARWRAVADLWTPHAGVGLYAFNDAHAMLAFVSAGYRAQAETVLAAQQRVIETCEGDNRKFSADVGYPLCRAIQAFAEGDYADCIRLLRPLRSIAQRFGGSHAQRDLIDLTLLEAAHRSGQQTLARALANERLLARPSSAQTRRLAFRASQNQAA